MYSSRSSLLLAGSIAAVAGGVAIGLDGESTVATLPALALVTLGIAGVTNHVAEFSVDRLRRVVRRWWLLAFVAFLPYGLATSPSSESAAAVGAAFSGPILEPVVEAAAGAAVLCVVAVTVLYGFARYGIHPGRQTPEERLLEE